MIKNPAAKTGDAGDSSLIPGLGRSPGRRNVNPLQYSCLGNSMDREGWWATIRGVTKSQTLLSDRACIQVRQNSIQTLDQLLSSYVVLTKSFNLPVLQFFPTVMWYCVGLKLTVIV